MTPDDQIYNEMDLCISKLSQMTWDKDKSPFTVMLTSRVWAEIMSNEIMSTSDMVSNSSRILLKITYETRK